MFNIKSVLRMPIRSMWGEFKYEFIRQPYWAGERGTKGWTSWDIAGPGFDQTYAKYIGHSLIWLGENNHSAPSGYPGEDYSIDSVTDFEAWSADLIRHGNALVALSIDEDFTEAETEYYDSVYFKDAENGFSEMVFPEKSEQAKRDMDVRDARGQARRDAADQAMLWVAQWYHSLWD